MKIHSLNYQRNGVAGEGFYQCSYSLDGESGLIATFTTESDERTIKQDQCRAIDPKDLNKAYRGDEVSYELNKWFAPCFKNKPKNFILYDMIEIINGTKNRLI